MYMEHLEEQFELTAAERNFIQDSETRSPDKINQSRIISELYLSKTIDVNVDKIIESNKTLSISNNEHSKWMKWLTFALVAVAGTQLIIKIYDVFS